MRNLSLLLAAVSLVSACHKNESKPEPPKTAESKPPEAPKLPSAPKGLFDPPASADNPQTPEKVALGKQLFFDKRLSKDGSASCQSCHVPEKGWTDGEKLSKKVGGAMNTRHSPTLLNVGYNDLWYWDGRADTLEKQILAAWKGQMGAEPDKIAEAVGVHETTVSRAISGKYMSTPHGVFEMKYFFTPGYQTAAGAALSNTSVKEAISDMVRNENARNPLSEKEIVVIGIIEKFIVQVTRSFTDQAGFVIGDVNICRSVFTRSLITVTSTECNISQRIRFQASAGTDGVRELFFVCIGACLCYNCCVIDELLVIAQLLKFVITDPIKILQEKRFCFCGSMIQVKTNAGAL